MKVKYATRNVLEPKGIVKTYRDFWWWCVDGDPKKAIVYKPSRYGEYPQCNSSEKCARVVGEKLLSEYPEGAQLIHIPLAFMPWES